MGADLLRRPAVPLAKRIRWFFNMKQKDKVLNILFPLFLFQIYGK